MTTLPSAFYRTRGKRIADVLLTLLLSPVLVPVALGGALVVRLSLGRPVLFRQRRIGLSSRSFVLFKLRTMTDVTGSDAERLSRIGALLRRTSIDEIPEFLNILRGEMSLVGPRPLLPEYLPRYSAEQDRRHNVLPGLTGLAQVRGRNASTWEERFAHDLEYVDNLSFRLDLKILMWTLWAILTGAGVSAPGHSTMPPFRGSDVSSPNEEGSEQGQRGSD